MSRPGYQDIRTVYAVVDRRFMKKGKCEVCGSNAIRSATFEQTINPWNKNADGELKTRTEIVEELKAKGAEWLALPLKHQKCET